MTISRPSISLQVLRAEAVSQNVEQRVLIVGQKTSSGSAANGALLEDLPVSNADINSLFGARSALAAMCRAFRAINDRTSVDVIPVQDNASGVQATADVQVTGTATESGTFYVEVGSGSTNRYQIDVVSGDTANTVAARINTAVSADTDAPFTSSNTTSTTTFTASNDGTHANFWTVAIDGQIAGLSFAITAWGSGATDPTIDSTLFDVVAGKRYQTVVWPQVFTASVLETFLDDRFNVASANLQGIGILTDVDSASNIKSTAAALNSPSMVVVASKAISRDALKGSAHREYPDVVSARLAAVRSLRLTDLAPLANVLTATAPLDQFGGNSLASLPYHNSIVPNMPIIKAVDQWTQLELEDFRDNGVATIGANRNFSNMILGDTVTTNTTNEAGDPDASFKFLETVDTVTAVRDAYFTGMRARYAQTRLTDGDLIPGRQMANQASIEAFTEEVWAELAEAGLVQGGAAALADFKLNRIVVVDVANGQASVTLAPLLVGQLRAIIGTITVAFGR